MSTLFVVATPIGNLGDLSPRAADTLRSVPLVAAEDTRVTRKLLRHIDARPKVISYHVHSPLSRRQQLLDALQEGDLAIVTDAGTPGISDPGADLVADAAAAGHRVIPIPGPSAVSAALSASGHSGDQYRYLGFLPRRAKDRANVLRDAAMESCTLVCLESPHRIAATLTEIDRQFADRPIAVCRELTKLHEEIFRGTAAEAVEHFEEPRGEFVIVIQGAPGRSEELGDDDIKTSIVKMLEQGLSGRRLVDEVVAATGEPRSRVYRLVLAIDGKK